MILRLLIMWMLFLAAYPLRSQSLMAKRNIFEDTGAPYQTHFSPKAYRADPQNWAMIQRSDGVMVIGNGDGVMTFDGVNWEIIPIANNNLVRCLAEGANRKVYIGGYNEIGYIDFTQSKPTYVSLLSQLSTSQREFGHTWSVITREDEVYFSTDKGIFKWSGNALVEIETGVDDSRAFVTLYQGKVFAQPHTEPLSVIKGNSLQVVSGGDFYRGKRITSLFAFDESRALVSTINDGLFLYDGARSKPFAEHMLDYFRTNRLYKAIRLRNGNMAFATLQKGVVILDPDGNVVQFLDKDSGLGDDVVYNLHEDREGALWTAMSVGLSRVELQSPMSLFNERNGLAGAVNDIARYDGKLYVATMLGLYQLHPAASATTHAMFRPVAEIHSSVWALEVAQDALLIATDNGTMEMKDGRLKYLDRESGAVMLVSEKNRNLSLVGLADGVNVLHFENGSWKSLGRIENLTADVGEMNEDSEGNIWLGTFSEGVVRLSFSDQTKADKQASTHPPVTHLGAAHGLPVGYVQLHQVGGTLSFRSEPHHRLYEYNANQNKFDPVPATALWPRYDSISQYPLAGEKAGTLWVVERCPMRNSYDLLRLEKDVDGYRERVLPFARVREDFDEVIFEDHDDIVWMGGLDGVLRYDLNMKAQNMREVDVVFNELTLTNDSVIHRGVGTVTQYQNYPYTLNSITFSYAATSFDLLNENEFQYILEGFDADWSSWSNHTTKSYTQIPEGDYTFKVRARDAHGNVSDETQYHFSIQPPWYRHPLAYAGYAIAFAALLISAVKVRSRKLERDNMALMRIIGERTAEVSSQNAQLEQQAEELKAQTEKLKEIDKLKSAFFANISHEFRTPLSLILAPLEKQITDGLSTQETEIMYRNGRRLQQLINQLLDLSRIESGQMKVFYGYSDLTSFVRALTQSFAPLAESRDIDMSIDVPLRSFMAYFDAEKVETVLYNLLSNALKFTPAHGRVKFSMHITYSGQRCEFVITDNGPGIPEASLDKIFDRFYQVESGSQRSFEGSGIGLALTRDLVLLMQGNISVESELGKGSTFRVALPLTTQEGKMVPDEIAIDPALHTHVAIAAVPESERPELPASSDTTILLVEDNQDLTQYLAGILEKHFRVQTAGDGEEALRLVHAEAPDLILSDMMMPRMDGFTLCEKIREDPLTSHLPFILLTARTTIESRLAGLELGADDYMTKPFVVAELLVRIKNLLHQRRQLRERFRNELTIAPHHVTVTSSDEQFLRKVMAVTESHMKDATFSVDRLSDEMGISRKHLHRKLVALAAQTPNEFIRVFRLKRAMQLLQQQSGNVKEIAYSVGFTNMSYFAKCFKEEFKLSPAEVAAGNAVVVH